VALGKETFDDGFFAEYNRGFAECPKHSAKSPSAVVTVGEVVPNRP